MRQPQEAQNRHTLRATVGEGAEGTSGTITRTGSFLCTGHHAKSSLCKTSFPSDLGIIITTVLQTRAIKFNQFHQAPPLVASKPEFECKIPQAYSTRSHCLCRYQISGDFGLECELCFQEYPKVKETEDLLQPSAGVGHTPGSPLLFRKLPSPLPVLCQMVTHYLFSHFQ